MATPSFRLKNNNGGGNRSRNGNGTGKRNGSNNNGSNKPRTVVHKLHLTADHGVPLRRLLSAMQAAAEGVERDHNNRSRRSR